MSTLTDWLDVTASLRRSIYADALVAAVDQVTATIKTKSGKFTQTHQTSAENIAHAAVTDHFYNLADHNGVANPAHVDAIWGPKANESQESTQELGALADWLAEQTWSDFAVSLADQYRRKGSLSPKQIESATSMRAKVEARNATKTMEDTYQDEVKQQAGLDLKDLPEGYYGIPDGETRLKVRVNKPAKGKWEGFIFVDDGGAYGEATKYGTQRPDGTYRGKIEDQLRKILADPKAAGEAYARLTGRCYVCNRALEDETSVALGIGPKCRA